MQSTSTGTEKLMMIKINKVSDMNEGTYSLEGETDKKSSNMTLAAICVVTGITAQMS